MFSLGLGLVHGDDYEYEGDDSQDFSEVGSIQGDDANSPNKKVHTIKVYLFWQGYISKKSTQFGFWPTRIPTPIWKLKAQRIFYLIKVLLNHKVFLKSNIFLISIKKPLND